MSHGKNHQGNSRSFLERRIIFVYCSDGESMRGLTCCWQTSDLDSDPSFVGIERTCHVSEPILQKPLAGNHKPVGISIEMTSSWMSCVSTSMNRGIFRHIMEQACPWCSPFRVVHCLCPRQCWVIVLLLWTFYGPHSLVNWPIVWKDWTHILEMNPMPRSGFISDNTEHDRKWLCKKVQPTYTLRERFLWFTYSGEKESNFIIFCGLIKLSNYSCSLECIYVYLCMLQS